jgi:CRP-like cAMP-binding protein
LTTTTPRITTFWDALPERARTALREAATTALIKPGTFLMREHTRGAQVYVLLQGAVKVWVDHAGEIAILDVLGPGDLVGEVEAADGGVRHANVEALTPVEALVVPAARFRAVLDAHPGAAWAVAAVLAERLRDANELRIAHFPDDAERRLASRLLRLTARFGRPGPGGGYEITVPVHQQDLGRWAGMGRRRVAQILAGERVRGGLGMARNMITVRSLDALRRLSGDPDLGPGGG